MTTLVAQGFTGGLSKILVCLLMLGMAASRKRLCAGDMQDTREPRSWKIWDVTWEPAISPSSLFWDSSSTSLCQLGLFSIVLCAKRTAQC